MCIFEVKFMDEIKIADQQIGHKMCSSLKLNEEKKQKKTKIIKKMLENVISVTNIGFDFRFVFN